MGSKPGKVQTASQNVKTPEQQYSYGGQNMTQAEAQAKYQADMAAWRAPTTTGTGYAGMETGTTVAGPSAAVAGGEGLAPVHLGVPTTDWSAQGLGAGGPAIPNIGILPTAPVVVPRQQLAFTMQRQPYRPDSGGGTAGDRRSSSGYGGSATGGAGRGSSARSGGLY